MPVDLWDTVKKTAPLKPVRYDFRLHDWSGAPWHVLRVELVEALNQPYRLTLELVVDESRLDIDDLLGDACTLDIDRSSDARTVHGLVMGAHDLGVSAGRHHVRLEVGPALVLLAQIVDTRAWQDLTAPDILRLVLAPTLAEHGRAVNFGALRPADYPRRDYCVQFRESDLAFAARLMEEEGITYYFDHDGPAERLVLVDDNRDFRNLKLATLELIATEPDTAPAESIQNFTWGRRLGSTAVAQRNFDWTAPDAPLAAARTGADRRGRTREVYEHDDIVYAGDGERHARIKHERLAVGGHIAAGTSNATGLSPGLWFALQGHARSELDDKFLVTAVIHRGSSPDAAVLAQTSGSPRYTNDFECIPLKEPYRPPLSHKKPRVSGLQTAIVTGPPGEEVHCDEHGRIKVLPHWDRVSPRDETSSFWLRVAQSVAGGNWGMFALPRIGQEVIVDFLDGDPDRPLVVGSVYNGSNAPPYALPAEKTKTTIKSNSSPGGGGSNELRFEDQAGAEEVYLHAQKDWNAVVGGDKTLSVAGSESDSIGGSRSVTVGGSDSLSVGGSRSMSIGAALTETVGANHSMSVALNQAITAGLNQVVGAGLNQSVSAGANQSVSATLNQSISSGVDQAVEVGGARTTKIKGPDTLTVTGSGRTETIIDGLTTTIVGAQATTVIGSRQDVVIGPSSEAATALKSLSAPMHFVNIGGMQLTVVAGFDLEFAQTRITSATSGIALVVGGTTIIVTDGKITITGGGPVEVKGCPVTIDGGDMVKLNGGVIKLNC